MVSWFLIITTLGSIVCSLRIVFNQASKILHVYYRALLRSVISHWKTFATFSTKKQTSCDLFVRVFQVFLVQPAFVNYVNLVRLL